MKYSLEKFVSYLFETYKENILLNKKSSGDLSPRLADLVYCSLNIDEVVKRTYKRMRRNAGLFGFTVEMTLKQSDDLKEAYDATKGKSYYEILEAVSVKSEEFQKEGFPTFKELFLEIAWTYLSRGDVTIEPKSKNIEDVYFELYEMLEMESVGISFEEFKGLSKHRDEYCKKG